MCNLSDGIWEKGIAKGLVQGKEEGKAEGLAQGKLEGRTEERKNVTAAFTSYMISEFGLSKEEAENRTKEFISNLDKDASLVM